MIQRPNGAAVPYAYLRRSSVQSKKPGTVSHESQLAAVKKLADDPRLVILEDWGVSGQSKSLRKRTGWVKLLAMIEAGRVSALYSYSMSRLARSVGDLANLIELCNQRGVLVTTVDGEINTRTASGRLITHILSAVDTFIADIAAEHATATRDTRAAAHDALGLPLPGSNPHYGQRHVTVDGITRVVDDPEHPIAPIVVAYRKAGSVRGACVLLQKRGILAPGGGVVWGSSTLDGLLRYYVPDELPTPNGRGRQRPAGRVADLFSRLVYCWCGATVTCNAQKGQGYCHRGRDLGVKVHGRYNISERALREALEPIAATYIGEQAFLKYKTGATDAERARLESRKERVLVAYTSGAMTKSRWRAETATLDAKLAEMSRQERAVDRIMSEQVPSWDQVAETNEHLRRIWVRVTLDHDYVPHVEWAIPDWMHDEAAFATHEEEMTHA